MTNPNYLEVAAWQDVREIISQPDAFTYRPERGYRWLQKLALWALKKIGAHQQLVSERRVYGPLRSQELSEKVFEAVQSGVTWEGYDARTYMVVMGRDCAKQFLHECRDLCHFTIPIDVRSRREYGVIARVYDVPVIVVPWIEGFAVVPQRTSGLR